MNILDTFSSVFCKYCLLLLVYLYSKFFVAFTGQDFLIWLSLSIILFLVVFLLKFGLRISFFTGEHLMEKIVFFFFFPKILRFLHLYVSLESIWNWIVWGKNFIFHRDSCFILFVLFSCMDKQFSSSIYWKFQIFMLICSSPTFMYFCVWTLSDLLIFSIFLFSGLQKLLFWFPL